MNSFQDDEQGEQITRVFESCELEAYWDPNGKVWTIGWGHTGPEVHAGLVWTQEQADKALEADRATALRCVNHLVTVELTQPEFDALVDFTFNLGCGRLESSTALKLLNAGDYHGAAAQLNLWDKSGGKVLAGLLRRRQAETELFESGDSSAGRQV